MAEGGSWRLTLGTAEYPHARGTGDFSPAGGLHRVTRFDTTAAPRLLRCSRSFNVLEGGYSSSVLLSVVRYQALQVLLFATRKSLLD